MYGVHKQYELNNTTETEFYFDVKNDNFLNDFAKARGVLNTKEIKCCLDLFDTLKHIRREKFNICYLDVIEILYERVLRVDRKQYTYTGLICKLMAYLLLKENCKTFFDPFCGHMPIVRYLYEENKNIEFYGCDSDVMAYFFTKVLKEGCLGNYDGIEWKYPIKDWNAQHFDAVVSFPPFGRILPNQQIFFKDYYRPIKISDFGLIYPMAFNINNANIVMSLEFLSFCFSPASFDVRKYIVDNNYVDTIVELPAGILQATNTLVVLIICKKTRNITDPIKFIYTDKYIVKENDKFKSFDVESLITELHKTPNNVYSMVDRNDIIEKNYNLHPPLYFNAMEDNSTKYALSDFLKLEKGEKIQGINGIGYVSSFFDKFVDVIGNQDKSSSDVKDSLVRKSCLYNGNSKYLLIYESYEHLRFALHTDGTPFACSTNVKVYSINENVIEPEYLVYMLTNNPILRRIARMKISMYFEIPLFEIENLSKQKNIVHSIQQKILAEKTAELEADKKRFGVRQNISDLEHMIAPTQLRIDNIIHFLNKDIKDETTKKYIKKLADNINYLKRTIQYNNSAISSAKLEEESISKFITEYIEGWNNYGNTYFNVKERNDLKSEDVSVKLDKTLLTVMFDSILDNAGRHGFNKQKKESNQLQISLKSVIYRDKPYVLVRVANNGMPFDKNFTINDYITKGRYSENSGRSGLGGYHVYEIVKKHNGYLYIDSDELWKVIVEILLPINNKTLNKKKYERYEKECV